MKRMIIPTIALTAAAMFLASPVFAGDACCPAGGNEAAAEVAQSKPDPHAGMALGREEKDFFKETKDGYTFRYEALPMSVKGATHHLMVYITDASGKPVTGAKIGYAVAGPDKREQKVMAMEMGDGYGANLDLTVKGTYTIRTKVVGERRTLSLNHEFVKEIN